jgi:hypothetical protein
MDAEGQVTRLPAAFPGRSRFLELITANTFPVVLVGLITTCLSLLSPGLFVADSWMTLASGREVVQHGLPHHDAITVWSHGGRWTDQQWLAQLAWYGIDSVAGIAGVALVGALVVALTYASAMAAARLLGASARSTFIVGFVALFVAPWSWQVRAQSFALPLFVWTLWLAADYVRRPSRRILAALPLLVLWANVHGTVVLGATIVSLSILVAAYRTRPQRAATTAVLLLVGTWVSALLTPYGTTIVSYYRLMLFDPPFARLISEWDRTEPAWITLAFYVVAGLTLVLAIWQRRRLRLFDTLVLLVTLAGALQAIRGITWFTLAVIVLVPRLLDGAIRKPDAVQMPRANAALSLVAITASVAVLVVVAAKPASWFERDWPPAAVTAVESAGPNARVFPSDRHADWLLWKLPDLRGRLAYDVRFELYERPQIIALARFEYQHGPTWRSVLAGYGVVVVDEQSDHSPTRALLREPGTKLLYHDESISVVGRPA